MAAHVITALLNRHPRSTPWDVLQGMVDMDCWTADLDFEHFSELTQIITRKDREALVDWWVRMIPIYRVEFDALGRPTNREQWLKVKYNF